MCRWHFILIFGGMILTACGGSSSLPTTENSDHNNDPSRQFIEAATLLEPLSEPLVTTVQPRTQPQPQGEDNIRLPPVNPLTVEGNLVIATSPGIDPLNQSMYQQFVEQGYGGIIQFNQAEAAEAIQLFCQDQNIDLLATTRSLQDNEIANCAAQGRQPIEFPVGQNALVIVVNRSDTFVKRVKLSNLAAILTVDKWSDVNPNWPDQRIKRFLINPESSGFDLMVEKVFNGNSQPILNAANTQFYQLAEPLIQALSATPYSVGFLSYRDYQQASQSLRAISLEGAAATFETAENGTYPFNQTLFLYADANRLKQKSQVSAFLNFYLTHIDAEINKGNYFPIKQTEIENAKMNWLRSIGFDTQNN